MGFELIRVNQLIAEKKISTVSPSIKLQTDDIYDAGKTAVVSQDQEFIVGYTDLVDPKLVDIPFVVFGDHTEIFKFIDFPFLQGADGIKIIKANNKFIDPKFLYYAFKSCYYPTGFYQRHFKLLKKTFIPNLPLFHQKKLSTVLDNYDQLIETNSKRIKLLESIAEQIYKEWFIRFRFPGYKEVSFKDKIPVGWEYKKFSDIYSFIRGVSYSSDEIDCEDGINMVNLKNINSYGGFRRDGLKKYNGDYKEKQKVSYGDLIMGVTDMTQDRRTVGWTGLVPDIKGVISMDLVIIKSEINNRFSQCLFKYGFYSKLFSQFGNGANVIHLKPDALRNQKILIPDKKFIDKFVDLVNPFFDEIENLYKQNEVLSQSRDSLLPRLMSGKLSVEGKEIV